MHLLNLQLKNICQHKTINWDFPLGLVGIFGKNGSGKSNAMAMAYACLTNDFRRLPGKKLDNIRSTASADAPSYARTTWEHSGKVFTITRDLRQNSNLLERDGKADLTRVDEIERAVEDILGRSLNIVDEFVFVRQWGMFDWLIANETGRARAYARFCDTERAERLWDCLGKQIAKDAGLASEIVDDTAQRKVALRQAQRELRETTEEIAGYQKQTLTEKAVAAARRAIMEYQRRGIARESMGEAKAAIRRAEKSLEEALEDLDKVRKQLHELSKRHEQALAWSAYDAAVSKRAELESRLAELEDLPVPEPPARYEDKSELQQEYEDVKSDLRQQTEWLRTFEKTGLQTCPTCGTNIVTSDIEAAKQNKVRLSTRKMALIPLISGFETYLIRRSEVEATNADRTKSRARISAQLDGLVIPPKPTGNPPDQKTMAQHGKKLSALRQKETELERRAGSAEGDKKARERDVQSYQKTLAGLHVKKEQYEEARLALKNHRDAKYNLMGLKERRRAQNQTVNRLTDELVAHKALLNRSKGARDFMKHLGEIRSVLHRESLPGIVHQRTNERLAIEINENLVDFESPFRVESGDHLTFRVHFRDGNEQSSDRLSGGELMITALAGRNGLNSIFASQLGMLVLDEPTAGLDQKNLDCLELALQRLARQTKDRGHQIIMITHETQLMGIFDKIIRVGS